jgi:hypothetical protein
LRSGQKREGEREGGREGGGRGEKTWSSKEGKTRCHGSTRPSSALGYGQENEGKTG